MSRVTQPCSHPEIELRLADFHSIEPDGSRHITLLDLLEIYPERITWTPGLDHARLVRHFSDTDISSHVDQSPSLRIFFIEDLNFLDTSQINANANPKVDNTAYWLHRRFGVSALFFDDMNRHFNGNSSLVRRQNGKRVSLDGHYCFTSGVGAEPTCLWFSHTLRKNRSSTYIIHQCPANIKNSILFCAQKDRMSMLLRPFFIDAFLADDSLYKWGEDVLVARNRLIGYENTKVSFYTPAQVAKAVENLHALSQILHVVRGHLTDLHERIHYLVKVYQRLLNLTFHPRHQRSAHSTYSGSFSDSHEESFRPGEDDDGEDDSVLDSFDFMLSKAARLMRWVGNYNERTGIRINLFFNISTQTDSKINLDIARLTSKIAVSTQRDSSSMITMAAVTMLFLPGTFVSALFSMVFFDTQPDYSLAISKQAWLFPAITIPLTVTVFVLWIMWQRYRNNGEARSLGIGNGDRVSAFEDSSGLKEKVGPDEDG